MKGFTLAAINTAEKHFNSRCKILTKSMEHEMKIKGTRSWCMLEEYVKDNCCARFHTLSNQYRNTLETQDNILTKSVKHEMKIMVCA